MPAPGNHELARYFGVAPEILVFVPELLQDFDALGSDPDLVVGWLGDEGVRGPAARVLDLGCGKGAVAVALARSLGCRVEGVDALEAFVESARRRAAALGVEELCTFSHGDLRDTVGRAREYDAVLLVSVGVLGSMAAMVAGCRACVRPGGLIVIEEGYLRRPGAVDFPGYQELLPREATIAALTAHGDSVLRERRTTRAEMKRQNRRFNAWIERRVVELSARHPEHAAAFHAFAEKERLECELLESVIDCATWLLRRASA